MPGGGTEEPLAGAVRPSHPSRSFGSRTAARARGSCSPPAPSSPRGLVSKNKSHHPTTHPSQIQAATLPVGYAVKHGKGPNIRDPKEKGPSASLELVSHMKVPEDSNPAKARLATPGPSERTGGCCSLEPKTCCCSPLPPPRPRHRETASEAGRDGSEAGEEREPESEERRSPQVSQASPPALQQWLSSAPRAGGRQGDVRRRSALPRVPSIKQAGCEAEGPELIARTEGGNC